MEIVIKEPGTGDQLTLDAQPEEYNDELGWRIFYPQKNSFLIAREDGDWKAVDEADMNPELIEAITTALRRNEEYNGTNRP